MALVATPEIVTKLTGGVVYALEFKKNSPGDSVVQMNLAAS